MAACVYCGYPSEEFANFCSSCGRPARPTRADAPDEGPPEPSVAVDRRDPERAATPSAAPDHASAVPTADSTLFATPMPTLVIQDGLNSRHVILTGDVYLLGRDPSSDIVVAAAYVSARHARIERAGKGHRIVDVGSRNGLLASGVRIKEHLLCDGDVLRIPDPRTSNFVTFTYLNPASPRVLREDTPARTFALPRDATRVTIGRSGADVNIENPLVSRRHASIEWRDDRHVLMEDGSTNGTYVNGVRVSRMCPLAAGDVIQIGPIRLRYDGGSLTEYDQRGAMRIDVRGVVRRAPGRGAQVERTILHDAWLSIEPREFIAIVGGSGAGKSTLMSVLSGATAPDEGRVQVNGDDFHRNFDAYRSLVGYVPQDDILHRTLPVERALSYVAKLRLPSDTTDREIARRVDRVLESVGMRPHRKKLVEQLSGGQRKRVSIACELLGDPPLLYLDEPTSGLDPGLEKRMMFTLRELADQGRTVVLVTHATANLMQCDHVVFMAEGRVVFFGPPREALHFFRVTSGDLADVYAGLEGDVDQDSTIVSRELSAELAEWKTAHPDTARVPKVAELWEIRWRRSPGYERLVAERQKRATPGPTITRPVRQAAGSRRPARQSFLRQFGILAMRYVELVARDRKNLVILLAQAPVIAALLCLVSDPDALVGGRAPYDAKKLLFMLSTVGVWFGIINAAREICKESSVFRRERMANLRIGPYIASKFAVLGGLVALQAAALLFVLNLKVRFADQGVVAGFGIDLFATTVGAGVAGLGIGLAISAFATTTDKAISAVPFALVPQILFAGLLFKLENATSVLSWFTASRWAMDAYGAIARLNEFHFADGSPVPVEEAYASTVANVVGCWALLAAYAVVCVAAIRVALRRRA